MVKVVTLTIAALLTSTRALRLKVSGPARHARPNFNLRVLVEINNAATVNINNLTIEGPAPNLNAGILSSAGQRPT